MDSMEKFFKFFFKKNAFESKKWAKKVSDSGSKIFFTSRIGSDSGSKIFFY